MTSSAEADGHRAERGDRKDDLQLIMPALENDDTADYLVKSGLVILRALAMEGLKVGVTLAFPIGGKVGLKVYDGIAGSDLFDSAMLHVLDVIGDIHTEAGRQALRDAVAEQTVDGKRTHQNRAATHLEGAYEGYLAAVRARAAKFGHRTFGMGAAEIGDLYKRAGEVGMTVALINRALGLAPAVVTWANNAKTQYDQYYKIGFDKAKGRFALDSDAARLEAESPEKTEFWDGSRTGEEWAADLARVGVGIAMAVVQKGRPNPFLRFETKKQRAAEYREEYRARRAAAFRIVRLDSQKSNFMDLYRELASQQQ